MQTNNTSPPKDTLHVGLLECMGSTLCTLTCCVCAAADVLYVSTLYSDKQAIHPAYDCGLDVALALAIYFESSQAASEHRGSLDCFLRID